MFSFPDRVAVTADSAKRIGVETAKKLAGEARELCWSGLAGWTSSLTMRRSPGTA